MDKSLATTAIVLIFGLISAAQAQAPTGASPDPSAASSPQPESTHSHMSGGAFTRRRIPRLS